MMSKATKTIYDSIRDQYFHERDQFINDLDNVEDEEESRPYTSSDPYEDSTFEEMEKNVKNLASFAKEAMRELEKNGLEDFVLLKNDKLRAWWKKIKAHEAYIEAKRIEKEHKERVRDEALAKLTDEELKILGLKRP